MATKTFEVPKMHCSGCEENVRQAVTALPGVSKCEPNATTKKVLVEFNPVAVDEVRIREALQAAGYPAN